MSKTIRKSEMAAAAAPQNARSILREGDDIALASTMITLGARLQVVESETSLSYDRLSRLYREINGCSAPKGMLPFSIDWFMGWRANVHSSIFYSIHQYLVNHTKVRGAKALIQAYGLYREHEEVAQSKEPLLSFTRAWMLLKFFNGGMLQATRCTHCALEFVTHAHEIADAYVCPICKPPARIVGMLMKEQQDKARAKPAGVFGMIADPMQTIAPAAA